MAATAGAVAALPVVVVLAVAAVAVGVAAPPPGTGASAIPPAALDAYRRAAATEAAAACGLGWSVLAAVGKVESDHAAGRSVGAEGTVSPPIVGRPLDGTGGMARVADTDGGGLDGDAFGDRAVGPMQFLPATWAAYGTDASGDGVADPHNLHDAAAGAARYLCAGGRRLDDDADRRAALAAWNPSAPYAEAVLAWAAAYEAAGTAPAPEAATGRLVAVGGIVVDASLAGALHSLLAAAAADGVVLGGSGYRSAEAQLALRRAHCGTSLYAVFDMPAEACSPPTARPGQSRHEAGLAIDFTCAGALVARGDACFAWLAATARRFGLVNLPSEPWHWSVDGR